MHKYFETNKEFSVAEIAKFINAEIIGKEETLLVKNIKSIDKAKSGDITFINNASYFGFLSSSEATSCIISKELLAYANDSKIKVFLLVKDPYIAFAKVMNLFYNKTETKEYVSPNCFIHKSSKIGKNCYIEDFVYIGENTVIGDNTKIMASAVIRNSDIGNNCTINSLVNIKHTKIGNNCIINEGAKIGGDGFGYAASSEEIVKIPQVGEVEIGNGVEIGSNTTIDRAALNKTIIGDYTKIDNLVQIGHNVEIGRGCFIVSQVGIAGSTKVGDFVSISGQAGVGEKLKIGSGSKLAMRAGVLTDIKENSVVMGYPAKSVRDFWRLEVLLNRLLKNREEKVKEKNKEE